MKASRISIALLLCIACLVPRLNAQQQVRVTIDNLQSVSADGEGFYFTPVFVGFDDNTFNLFNSGQTLGSGTALETLAEQGDAGPLTTLFNQGSNTQSGVINRPGGLGPGLFNPGSAASQTFTLDSGQTHFNFATMLIPTNDAFLGTEDSIALFDGDGNFQALDLTLTLSNVWDSGTELNDRLGAPFSNFGGDDSTIESEQIGLHTSLDLYDSDTNLIDSPNFLNGDGQRVNVVAGSDIIRIRISAVPEPSFGLLGIGAFACIGLARRNRKSS